ncbi:hypothetical protein L1049_001337 [Liquidambar formosana]|uniref:Uncharacterized protein n=1 Tax=Liquidambar formosana TaxID=63359 RepID=A0AAP0NC63_LIQFO
MEYSMPAMIEASDIVGDDGKARKIADQKRKKKAQKIRVTLKIRVTPMRHPSVNSPPSYRAMSACVKKAWRERDALE